MRMRTAWLAIVLASASLGAAAADFKGKTIDVIVGSAPGGGTDATARLLVPLLQKHLPGNPTMVVRNMPGAEGVTALNYVVQQTKPDGLTLVIGSNSQLSPTVYRKSNGIYDPRSFRYIGGVGRGGSVVIANRAREARLYDRAAEPLFFGTLNGLRAGELTVFWAMEYLGWNAKPVVGYRGTNDVVLAMDRGEIDLNTTSNLFQFQKLMDTGRFHIVVQSGIFSGGAFRGRPELPGVRVLMDLISDKITDPVAQGAFRYWQAALAIDKWLGLIGGTRDDVVASYRDGFQAAMSDPELTARGAKISEDMESTSPQDMEYLAGALADVTQESADFIQTMERKHGLDAQ